MTTSPIIITGFYAGILAILYIALSMKVINHRRLEKIGIGDDGGNCRELAKAIRVHANFIEYVPLALLMMAFYEHNGGHAMALHVIGGLLVMARFFHAIGLGKTTGTSWQRFIGTITTFVVILALAVVNIIGIF
ncbi:MAPEG family protein [Thalassotalea maritima]|uniref:MAPEG family protein n=1 Tax=Thalassotalea maritima TaxID=3242416 RepID=UPI003528AD7C